MKFSRLGKGECLDHMVTWSSVEIKLIYSWTIHELFMNKCSWTIPELFMFHFLKLFMNKSWTIVHELLMNYSSWTIHELTSSWTQIMNSKFMNLTNFMNLAISCSWIVHELFMNMCSWTAHELFKNHSWTVHDHFTGASEWRYFRLYTAYCTDSQKYRHCTKGGSWDYTPHAPPSEKNCFF